jgi:hypothetical protein
MTITPSSSLLRGGWRVAGCVTAIRRVVCFRIGFYTGRRGQASAGLFISAFDVTAGVRDVPVKRKSLPTETRACQRTKIINLLTQNNLHLLYP